MLYGTVWEVAIPAVIALVAIVLWIAVPESRRHPVLRAALIVGVALTAMELMLAALIFGVFFLSGGMANF